MAGAIDALRNITSDRLFFIKIPIYALPIYFYLTDYKSVMAIFGDDLIFWACLSIVYLGISSFLISRNISNKKPLLPNVFDIFSVIIRMAGSLIASIVPIATLCGVIYLIENYLTQLDLSVVYILEAVSFFILFPFVCVPIVLYSVNGKISDIFRAKQALTASGDFIASFIKYIIQFVLTIGIGSFCIYKAIENILGKDSIGLPICIACTIALSFLMVFSWASDMYGQTIPEIPEKKWKDKALRETF